MPSGLRKTTGNHFEIYYEQPWGGVASDKDPVDIAENQLVVQQGMVETTGTLDTVALVKGPFFGIGVGIFPVLFWVLNNIIYSIDQFGTIYILTSSNFIPVITFPGYPWAFPPDAAQVINGVVYISNFGLHSIYSYDGITPLLASDYTGGRILGILDDYLLQMNTNNIVDGPQPNRINWSGPGEFSTWDPSIDRSAGFNTLAAVEDQITGFYSLASVGLVLTEKGLVELSPTGVAIGPFDFTTLWTSQIGKGCIYPFTVDQYGQVGYLVTDSGSYTVSTGAGFTEVTGSANKAILSEINGGSSLSFFASSTDVAASVMLYFYNSNHPTPFYTLVVIIPGIAGTPKVLSIWMLNINKGTWHNVKYDVDTLVINYGAPVAVGYVVNNLKVTSLAQPKVYGSTTTFPVTQYLTPTTYISFSATDPNTNLTYPAIFYLTFSTTTVPSPLTLIPVTTLMFRPEELKLGFTRKPTIRRVIVKAYGTGTLNLAISGQNAPGVLPTPISFGSITLLGSLSFPSTYYSPLGQATVEDPQLTITSTNFIGRIVKVMLAGTYADGEID